MLLRRGNVHMFAAAAGMSKTMVMLNAVLNMGSSAVVFSSDSDDLTIASRIIAIRSGKTTDEAEEWMDSAPEAAAAVLRPLRERLKWQFHPNPTPDDVWHELYAYLTVYGEWPDLVVIDILSDIGHDSGDEWASLRDATLIFKSLARQTDAAVLLVHHASEGVPSSRVVPSRSDIMGKLASRPALMVTFGKDEYDNFWVACVKNRFGPAKADGSQRFRMTLDASRSLVTDHQPRAFALGHDEKDEEWWR